MAQKSTFGAKVHLRAILAPGRAQIPRPSPLPLAQGATWAHFSGKVHFSHLWAPRGPGRSLNPRRARAAGGGPPPRAGQGLRSFPKCALCPGRARGGGRSLNARSAPGGHGAEAVP